MKKTLSSIGLTLVVLVSLLALNPSAAFASTTFLYAGARQLLSAGTTAQGIQSSMLVAEPYLDAVNDGHTLMEEAAKDTASGNTIEFGWNVDFALYGDTEVHLFSGGWRNGVFLGYNASAVGYVDYGSNATDIGANLHAVATNATFTSRIKQFTIQRDTTVACGSDATGGWWIRYDGAFIGCYQNSIWGAGVFTSVNDAEYFGEVPTFRASGKPCSDMGNGKPGNSYTTGGLDINDPAFFTSTSWVNSPIIASSNTRWSTDPNAYDAFSIGSTGDRTFTLGGKGYTSTGTTPGNLGSC